MTTSTSAGTTVAGHKRSRPAEAVVKNGEASTSGAHVPSEAPPSSSSTTTSASSFRNVSACNRCRARKNKCDLNLPACSPCARVGQKCVGYDPITRRKIPRVYVYYLESRVHYLEELLSSHGVAYEAPTDFDLGAQPVTEQPSSPPQPGALSSPSLGSEQDGSVPVNSASPDSARAKNREDTTHQENEKLSTLVNNIGMTSLHGASDPRFLGSTSGISFARVVAAAIRQSTPNHNDRRSSTVGLGAPAAVAGGASMRDAFFSLQTKPNMKPAPFPDREIGLRLVNRYFSHANPQIPILHRAVFMELFERAYQSRDRQRSAKELYLLNIVFAIGAGIIMENPSSGKDSPEVTAKSIAPPLPTAEDRLPDLKRKKARASAGQQQRQPEEYHAAAMVQLEAFLGSMHTVDSSAAGLGGGLEQLQAILLLASFALLRPVAPGLWYITGVALRLALDLGLHFEDAAVMDDAAEAEQGFSTTGSSVQEQKERGARQWIRDLRRRLWWCTYSFDRLVSTCVGRPLGVADEVITADWPTILDDIDVTPQGFRIPPHEFKGPSYKRVSHHYFRLRLLQSEMLTVLQYRQATRVHEHSNAPKPRHAKRSNAYLQPFNHSFRAWRADIDRRLWEWKESAPLQQDTSSQFSVRFLELNYWQAVIMLYRTSLSVPTDFPAEKGPQDEVESPLSPHHEEFESVDDIYLKVAQAGQRVLTLYKQLHKERVVNYTYLATFHLFMAGVAFLYSLWHSQAVRKRLTMQHVNFTVLAGVTVLTDLIDKCPPAEDCRDAFDRMSKATIIKCQSTLASGSQVKSSSRDDQAESQITPSQASKFPVQQSPPVPRLKKPVKRGSRPPPTFDYDLKELFPDNLQVNPGNAWQYPKVPEQTQSQQLFAAYPSPTPSQTSVLSTTNTSTSAPTQSQGSAYDPRLFAPPSAASAAVHSTGHVSGDRARENDFPLSDIANYPDLQYLMQDLETYPPGQGYMGPSSGTQGVSQVSAGASQVMSNVSRLGQQGYVKTGLGAGLPSSSSTTASHADQAHYTSMNDTADSMHTAHPSSSKPANPTQPFLNTHANVPAALSFANADTDNTFIPSSFELDPTYYGSNFDIGLGTGIMPFDGFGEFFFRGPMPAPDANTGQGVNEAMDVDVTAGQ